MGLDKLFSAVSLAAKVTYGIGTLVLGVIMVAKALAWLAGSQLSLSLGLAELLFDWWLSQEASCFHGFSSSFP